jgi:hypothetical protein
VKILSRKRRGPGADDAIVVVSGLPRSGTSMMMRMLAAGGVEPVTDGRRTADIDNPGGYYELERVKKIPAGDVGWLADSRGKAVKVIAAVLFDLPEDYTYKVILMKRRMEEVLASQRRMLINRGQDPDVVPDEEMARLFSGHLERVEVWLDERTNVDHVEVDYNQLVTGGGSDAARRISEFLRRPLDTAAMEAVVDPALYRRRT